MRHIRRCADCGAALEPWETIYSWHGVGWLCEDCFRGKIDELSNAEFAQMVGSEVCLAEDLDL